MDSCSLGEQAKQAPLHCDSGELIALPCEHVFCAEPGLHESWVQHRAVQSECRNRLVQQGVLLAFSISAGSRGLLVHMAGPQSNLRQMDCIYSLMEIIGFEDAVRGCIWRMQ